MDFLTAAIFTLVACVVLIGSYITVTVVSIVGLCKKNLRTKKKLLITSIVFSSFWALIDIAFILGVLETLDATEVSDVLGILGFCAIRTGLFIAQIVNYVKARRKEPEFVFMSPQVVASGMRWWILFAIGIPVFGGIAGFGSIAILGIMLGAMIGAGADTFEDNMMIFALVVLVGFILMIGCIIGCVVFKKIENRKRKTIQG